MEPMGSHDANEDRAQADATLETPEDGYVIRTVPELLGHEDVKTTMIHAHVLTRRAARVKSPPDRL